MTFEPTAELARGNKMLKELHALPEARLDFNPFGDAFRAWRVFSRLQWSMDGTTEQSTAITAECLIAEAPTMAEALARAHRINADPAAMLHFRERHIRGLPTNLEPPPLTPEEKRDEDALRERLRVQKERAIEGQRKHLRNFLKRQGLEQQARKFHKRTGLLPNLFGSITEFFDVGRKT